MGIGFSDNVFFVCCCVVSKTWSLGDESLNFRVTRVRWLSIGVRTLKPKP